LETPLVKRCWISFQPLREKEKKTRGDEMEFSTARFQISYRIAKMGEKKTL